MTAQKVKKISPISSQGVSSSKSGNTKLIFTISRRPTETQTEIGIVSPEFNAVVAATDYARNHKDEAIAVAMLKVGYLGKEAVEGNYDVLREWYSNEISETAIAHIVEVLELKSERFPTVKLDDFADLSFLMRTRQVLR